MQLIKTNFIKSIKYLLFICCTFFITNEGYAQVPVVNNSLTTASSTINTAFNYQISATNVTSTFNPISYSETGTLPTGLSLNATTGLISGTPTALGSSNISLFATNKNGTSVTAFPITINIIPPSPLITSSPSASGTEFSPFSYSIIATNTPTSYSVSGALPAGVTLNTSTGVISGTPTAAGSFSITTTATNAGGIGQQAVTITITCAPATVTITTPSNCLKSGLYTTLTVSPAACGTCSYSWAVTSASGTGAVSNPVGNTERFTSNGHAAVVTATYTDGACISTGSINIYVTPPTPSFVVTCATAGDASISITDPSYVVGDKYSLAYSTSISSPLNFLLPPAPPSLITPNSSGVFTVPINTGIVNSNTIGYGIYDVAVNNGTCTSWTTPVTVPISPQTISINSSNSCFSGSPSAALTVTPAGNYYTWTTSPTNGSFSSTTTNPTTYTNNGHATTITATYSNGSCTKTATYIANIGYSISGSSSIPGGSAQLVCVEGNANVPLDATTANTYLISGSQSGSIINWSTSSSSLTENSNLPTSWTLLSVIQPTCTPCLTTSLDISGTAPAQNGIIQLNANVNGCPVTSIPLYVGTPAPTLIKPTAPSSYPATLQWTAGIIPYTTGYYWSINHIDDYYTTGTGDNVFNKTILAVDSEPDIASTFCQAANACGISPKDFNRPAYIGQDSIVSQESTNYIISPNPASNVINISVVNGESNNASFNGIAIYDISGARKKFQNYQQTRLASIDISSLANGTYLVEIFNGTSTQTQKIIIQR